MFATTRSKTINGTNIINPISNDVFNSLIINAGAICQIVNSSGLFGAEPLDNSTKNAKSFSLVCFSINSLSGFEPSSIVIIRFWFFW